MELRSPPLGLHSSSSARGGGNGVGGGAWPSTPSTGYFAPLPSVTTSSTSSATPRRAALEIEPRALARPLDVVPAEAESVPSGSLFDIDSSNIASSARPVLPSRQAVNTGLDLGPARGLTPGPRAANSKWILIYGIPPGGIAAVVAHFQSLGQVEQYQSDGNCNWLHVKFADASLATRALGKAETVIRVDGVECMLGVRSSEEPPPQTLLGPSAISLRGGAPPKRAVSFCERLVAWMMDF